MFQKPELLKYRKIKEKIEVIKLKKKIAISGSQLKIGAE